MSANQLPMNKDKTNLDRACQVFGWSGGTIHEVARQVGKWACRVVVAIWRLCHLMSSSGY